MCTYSFTTKANCERHIRNRHSRLSEENVKKSIIYHPSEDPTNDPDLQTKVEAQDKFTTVGCDELKHESRQTQSPHKTTEQRLIGIEQTRPWKKTQEAATMTNNLKGCETIEDQEMSHDGGLDEDRQSNGNISSIDARATFIKNSNNTFPKSPTTENQSLPDIETRELTPVRRSASLFPSPVRDGDSTFPIHPAQPPFTLHPNLMSHISSSTMEEFRSRLHKELINNLQLSCGTTFASMMASTAERLQAINSPTFSEYSGGNPEEKMDCGGVKVEEEDEENELVIDEENDTDDEAADKTQSKEETKDTFSEGNSRTGVISSAKAVDLSSAPRLLDNATTHTQAFQRYFRGTQDGEDALEGSEEDEEGLYTGSNSEGNNSGSDENK
jgi:hypothetical protein